MTIDETARQIVEAAWAEFANAVGPSAMPLHPEMRALMMALVTSGMKVEREACAKVADRALPGFTGHTVANKIRARCEAKEGSGER